MSISTNKPAHRPDGPAELPQVTRYGVLDMQVCVPEKWSDEQVIEFAETAYPCGTNLGWQIRRTGNPDLDGDPERNPCSDRLGYVHIMLDS